MATVMEKQFGADKIFDRDSSYVETSSAQLVDIIFAWQLLQNLTRNSFNPRELPDWG